MKIALIGNAEIKKNASRLIDACDVVVRCNEARNLGRNTGQNTDILCIRNVGGPAQNYVNDRSVKPLPRFPNLSEVWFARNTGKDKDKSAEIVESNELSHLDIKHFSRNLNRQLEDELMQIHNDDNMVPSTGILALYYIINDPKYTDYDKYIFGFTFEMWAGHSARAERILIEKWMSDRNDLFFIPANYTWRWKRLFKDSIFFSKIKKLYRKAFPV